MGLALGGAIALLAAGCSGGRSPIPSSAGSGSEASTTTAPSTGPSPATSGAPTSDLNEVALKLTQIASLESAIAMSIRPDDEALYVAEREGVVVALRGGQPETVLDIRDQVTAGGEQGLLGLAFSPDGAFLYVNYTNLQGDTRVDEFPFRDGHAVASEQRQVLLIDQPFSNHQGGNIVFGPDGFLYVGMGDGGSQGDPNGNGQNLGVLLAKMLRIDPARNGDQPYGVPADNPFVGIAGAQPEVWDYGLRNPWRWSFDRQTGDLWIADVGGSEREEIDFEPAGSGGNNYGWNLVEGTVVHGDSAPPDAVPPVFEYVTGQDGTCAITGGYVYRGSAIPGLAGAYLYSDFCGGDIRAFRLEAGKPRGETSLGIRSDSLASFGQDRAGELYVLCLCGDVFRIDPA